MNSHEDSIALKLHNSLLKRDKTLSLAESCTGGLIAHRLTSLSGSSQYLKLGIVVYSSEAKIKLVGVNRSLIQEKGDVGEEVAIELAVGIRNLLETNIGLGITGWTGPTGGTEDHPVGTAFVAIDFEGKIEVKKIHEKGDRMKLKSYFADEALKLLYNFMEIT